MLSKPITTSPLAQTTKAAPTVSSNAKTLLRPIQSLPAVESTTTTKTANISGTQLLQCQLPSGAVAFLVPAVPVGMYSQPTPTTTTQNTPQVINRDAMSPLPAASLINSLTTNSDVVTLAAADSLPATSPPVSASPLTSVKERLKVTLAAKIGDQLEPGQQQFAVDLETSRKRKSETAYLDDEMAYNSQLVASPPELDESRQKILERNR